MSFWCITAFFNPAGYKQPVENYKIFAENIHKQKVNLLTLEVAFDNHFWLSGDVVKICGNSVMWLKERLINHGISLLPTDCDVFAWVDADLIWANDNWQQLAQKKLQSADIIQLFKRVFHLPRNHNSYQGKIDRSCQGIIQQFHNTHNWYYNRKEKNITFSAPGFAWAARRDAFKELYDRDVFGSGDCVLADCLLGCWDLHGYEMKYTDKMKKDIQSWQQKINKRLRIDYLPVDVFHLWHGELRNRRYMRRHTISLAHDYDPMTDIRLNGGVYEWASNKTQMHQEINDYFSARLEDGML